MEFVLIDSYIFRLIMHFL